MKFHRSCVHGIVLLCLTPVLRAQDAPSTTAPDTSPHTVQMVSVDKDVKLEVLDWEAQAGRSFCWRVRGSPPTNSISSRPH
jgi:hypothetical protein